MYNELNAIFGPMNPENNTPLMPSRIDLFPRNERIIDKGNNANNTSLHIIFFFALINLIKMGVFYLRYAFHMVMLIQYKK
jgi:hypothetical protein